MLRSAVGVVAKALTHHGHDDGPPPGGGEGVEEEEDADSQARHAVGQHGEEHGHAHRGHEVEPCHLVETGGEERAVQCRAVCVLCM